MNVPAHPGLGGDPVYLDHNATTPVDPRVAEAARPWLERWFGNPSSGHALAAAPRAALACAREQIAALIGAAADELGACLLVGLDTGDDAAVVRLPDGPGAPAVVATADFFTPVVDDPYDWGRIAAANALSDVYAMGGTPLVAVNLLCWPRDVLPFDLARDVLRGGLDVAARAGCLGAGGHSVDDPEPKYGMAVTGTADPSRLLRNDAGRPGMPLSLTKPLGLGVLNNRHKTTGEVFPQAVETMTTLNRAASEAALAAGAVCATDVTGFGLLGHLYKLARASGVTAVLDPAAVPSSTARGTPPGPATSAAARAATSPGSPPHRLRRHRRAHPAPPLRRADLRGPPRRRRDPGRPGRRRTRTRRPGPAGRPLTRARTPANRLRAAETPGRTGAGSAMDAVGHVRVRPTGYRHTLERPRRAAAVRRRIVVDLFDGEPE
jgi:selenium donor protein